jgi:hypothetical protein
MGLKQIRFAGLETDAPRRSYGISAMERIPNEIIGLKETHKNANSYGTDMSGERKKSNYPKQQQNGNTKKDENGKGPTHLGLTTYEGQ